MLNLRGRLGGALPLQPSRGPFVLDHWGAHQGPSSADHPTPYLLDDLNTNTSLHPLTPQPQASELQKEPPTPKVCRLQMDHSSILLVTACCGLAPGEVPGR